MTARVNVKPPKDAFEGARAAAIARGLVNETASNNKVLEAIFSKYVEDDNVTDYLKLKKEAENAHQYYKESVESKNDTINNLRKTTGELHEKIRDLNAEVYYFKSMSFWKRLKFAFV